MAKLIHCEKCKNRTAENAKQFGELYESLEGMAKFEMFCDAGGEIINKGDKCFASVLLPNNFHPNYRTHKPLYWAAECIEVKHMDTL